MEQFLRKHITLPPHATCRGSGFTERREIHLKEKKKKGKTHISLTRISLVTDKDFSSCHEFSEDRFNGKHMDSSLLKINLTLDDHLFTF